MNAKNEDIEPRNWGALLSVLPDNTRLYQNLKKLPERFASMTEDELIDEAKPTTNDWALRHSFWSKFGEFINSGDLDAGDRSVIQMVDIYRGICSPKSFHCTIDKPHKLAFILCPMQTHQEDLNIQAIMASKVVARIMNQEIKIDANWCPKKAMVVLRASSMILERAFGQAIQRSINLNVNTEVDPQQIKDRSAMDREIEELTQKLSAPRKNAPA